MFTKPFGQLGKEDAAIAGGKGASLGEMTQAGIPVPPGFVVVADSFEHFLKETDLNVEVDAIIDKVNHKDIASVERASEEIQALILAAAMPADIEREIESEFVKLGAQYVAVRSSATAEDSSAAAWAGQLDSYLNTTESNLLEKVKHCWASLFTPRAIFYRFEKGLHDTKISVAVVVQKMVASEVSGIAFSVHPVTEDRNQLIIEAGLGLGEAIVSGQITPDSYVVEKEPRRIIDKNIAEQARGIYRKGEQGNEWRDIEASEGAKQKLSDAQILELAVLIMRIENHYGFPCDIEWAFEGGTFYIVQSRPITTLAPQITDTSESQFKSPELKGFNPDDYHFDGLWKNDLFATCFWQDCWVPDVVAEMKLDLDGVGVMNLKGGHYLVNKAARARMDRQMKQMIDEKNTPFFKNLVSVSDQIFDWAVKKGEELAPKEPSVENFRDFCAAAKKLNFLWLIGATYINWPVEEKLQEAVVEDKFPADHVLDIIPKITTPLYHYQQGLAKLKKSIGGKSFAEVEKDPALLGELKDHANKYVWVEIFNFIGEPLTPEKLFGQIGHLEDKGGVKEEEYVPSKPLSPKLKFITECMYNVGYVKQGGAEYFSIFSEKVLPFLRAIAEKIGVTYREFMCLGTWEVDQALDGKLDAIELKKRAARRIGVNDWAVIAGSDGQAIFIEEPADIAHMMEKMVPRTGADTKELVGQRGNRGKYTGPVRVVMNTYDFDKVKPGDVLVTTMTTPDFIILMQKSGAIVTDIGGLLCHAAIVSRELQKPCVIGTKFATQVLKDDEMVEVDADAGVVRKLEVSTDPSLKKKYEKVYTRECCLISFEIWEAHQTKYLESKLAWNSLPAIYNVADGVGEVYFVKDIFSQWERQIARQMSQSPSFAADSMEWYRSLLVPLEKAWKADRPLADSKALVEFYEQASQGWVGLALSYFIPGMSEASDGDKKLAMEMREKVAAYLDDTNRILEKTLEHLYPALGKLASYISIEEIRIGNVPTLEQLTARKGHYIYFESQILTGITFEQFASQRGLEVYADRPTGQSTQELKGETAMKGKVRGQVRVILKRENLGKLKDGEILVAAMTTPDYLPAMQKAAAFVTDEGGVTCHAAIVAREMKKPCIIGTKIATQVLKDGDMVEVDADAGVVRKLEGANNVPSFWPKIEDYTFTFGTEGTTVLFQDLVSLYYDAPEEVTTYESGTISSYLSKKTLTKMAEDGLAMKHADLQKTMEHLRMLIEETKVETPKLKEKQNIIIEDVEEAFIRLAGICGDYFWFDNNNWNAAFEVAEKDSNAKANVELVGKFKNELRTDLGLFFEPWGYLGTLTKGIAKTLGVPEEEIGLYRTSEVLDLFAGKRVTKESLQARQQTFVNCKETDGTTHFYEGREALKFIEHFGKVKLDPSATVIKGKTANNTGKVVRGKVRIIGSNYSDAKFVERSMAEMQEGEILVSQTTAPELMPALKKAAAVVTDTGGMLSHAAITSRELGIPCIVDTVTASKILKTGDMVEVDATNGVVRKIEDTRNTASEKWVKQWERGLRIQKASDYCYSIELFEKAFGRGLFNGMYVSEESGASAIYVKKGEWDSFVSFYREAYKDVEFCKKFADLEKLYEPHLKFINELDAKNLEKLSNADFVALVKKYKQSLYEFYVPMWTAVIWEPIIEEAAYNVLSAKLDASELEAASLTVFSITKPNYLLREEEALVRLATLSGLEREAAIVEHAKAYEYIPMYDYDYTPYTKEQFETRLKELKLEDVESKEVKVVENAQALETLLARKEFDANDRLKLGMINVLFNQKDERSHYRSVESYKGRVIHQEIARRLRSTLKQVLLCLDAEIVAMLSGSLAPLEHAKILEQRAKKNAFVYEKGQITVYVGTEMDKYLKENSTQDSSTEIKGLGISKGKATGKVRIIKTIEDMSKLEAGNVLVASMTRPDYVSAMKISAAIVTDEGGLLCHAAIVSRELNLPCVVGTKVATKVLKDGDMVEVDADKGIVRKL